VDLSASFRLPAANAPTLRVGLRNVFDRDVRFPAPLTQDVIANTIQSYATDYPQQGRSAWLELAWRL